MEDWLPKSDELIRKIAADDLVGRGCYIVNFSEVEAYEPRLRGGRVAGWTSPIMDLILADWLTKQRRWTGRGFATILHADLLPRWMDYAGAVLHEFGHYLTLPPHEDCDEIVNRSQTVIGWLPLQWAERKHEPPPVSMGVQLPRWHDHEADFVRACCHLAYRAQHSVYIRPEHLRFIGPYHSCIVHEDHFMQALGEELEQTGSIREILQTPTPELFVRLWKYAIEANQ